MFEKLYSPVHKITYSSYSFAVKRDDLIDPYISGNKWRKLKYILQEAAKAHKNHLVTFGGAYSNHLVATAAAAARQGLKATAFVRGEEVNNEMLMLCKTFGMQLRFTDRSAYQDKHKLFNDYFSNDAEAYFIDEGGASVQAVKGCSELISELPEVYDHIFCAAGTGTTAAGLLKSIQEKALPTQLHVIPVLKGGAFIRDEIIQYTSNANQLVLHTDYHFGGYAKTTSELIAFIKHFTSATGLLIDPVYTAKMFYAIFDQFKQGAIQPGEKVLAIHTGGLLGILGMKDKFY